jgi:hypothetical protein
LDALLIALIVIYCFFDPLDLAANFLAVYAFEILDLIVGYLVVQLPKAVVTAIQ